MLTLLAIPKPFRGNIDLIQRNAISSWTRLEPSCEVILFGDEAGIDSVAKEFCLRHVPRITHNQYGTPLLNDVFEKGRQLAKNDLLCFVNCDIILKSDFLPAIKRLLAWRRRFLMVGECWDLDVVERLALKSPMLQDEVDELLREKGRRRGPDSIDYFVFPSDLYPCIPDFVLGRAWFDQWLIWQARCLGVPVVDASAVVIAVHQNHDYSHVAGGKFYTQHGAEAMRNLELAGGLKRCLRISEASHRLLPAKIKRNWRGIFGRRVNERAEKWLSRMIESSRPFRHPLGLSKSNLKRLLPQILRSGRWVITIIIPFLVGESLCVDLPVSSR
jgi:hypothetical protein